ncbi:MAG: zinc ribbon domain-containing protein [Terracidiphilus sp.]|jgi:hypothetical protein
MELTCIRCHQTVQDGYCYCPTCGLPQLIYSAETSADAGQSDRWGEAVRDANTVDWKSALRSALLLAIPAGLLCSILSPVGIFGLLLMGATAAWAVVLYMRSQRPAWITVGAGARIGLVTGVLGGWTAAAMTGLSLYAMRFWLHQGSTFDSFWQELVNQQQAQGTAVGADVQTLAAVKALMISAEGRAGLVLFGIAFLMATLVLFAIAGGALSARLLARTRRQGN